MRAAVPPERRQVKLPLDLRCVAPHNPIYRIDWGTTVANILVLSSWVAHGHVGICAAQPVLQALGHSVTALPTVMLSNHRGWPHCAGDAVPVAQLEAMVDALVGNGWMGGFDALLVGYMPSVAHVSFAADLCEQLPALVDPVLGDDPRGLYVPGDVAEAVRDTLVPKAQTLTPNRFELSYLSGREVDDMSQALEAAQSLLGSAQTVCLTSPPLGETETGFLTVTRSSASLVTTERAADVPNGTGDALAALLAAGMRPGAAMGHLDALIRESLGAPHLRIAETAPSWTRAAALPTKDLPWPSTSS